MSGPTGRELVDRFLAELDARIEGTSAVEQPVDSRARLVLVRDEIRREALRDPEEFEERLRGHTGLGG